MLLSCGGYLALALAGDLKARAGLFLCVNLSLHAVYLVAVRRVMGSGTGGQASGAAGSGAPVRAPAAIIWAALAFRLILWPATPTLSDDIYRYIWEGGLQLERINPYRYAPADPALEPYRDRIYEGVNYKDLPAIYPPLMQWVFALGAALSRSPMGMKAPFIAADIGVIILLRRLLAARGLEESRILIYAWNPLAVIEVAGSGHNDPLAVCFLVASTLGIIWQRRMLSMTALAAAALSKLFPITLLPLFAKRVKPWLLVLPPMLMAACYLPYASAGGNLLRSVKEYAERWRSNDSLFRLIEAAVQAGGISPAAKEWADAHGLPSLYTQPHMIARLLVAVIALAALCLLAWLQQRRGMRLERSIFLFTGLAMLLQPSLHPWYLLWILPWLALYPSPAWLALAGLVGFSYTDAAWARWLQYVPFYALLLTGPTARRALWPRMVQWASPRRDSAG